jgi:hypothetical protein
MLDSPDWMAVTAKAARFDPYIALQDICIGIPRLLERTDNLAKDGAPQDQLDALLHDSEQLANCAFHWLSNFEKNGPRYDMVPIERFEGFFDLCADRVFDSVFDFHYFGAGICYLIYWMSMLIMQGNTFKLLRQHKQLELKQLMMWDRQLGGYADSICRCIPYNCRPVTGYAAKFGSLTPLVLARKYFEMKGPAKAAEAKWCETVYLAARVPGLYSMSVPLDPMKAVRTTVENNDRKYI